MVAADVGRALEPAPFAMTGSPATSQFPPPCAAPVSRGGKAWAVRQIRRHPLVWSAALWAIPAILFGAFLRLLVMSYSPYAYWGSDSQSYFLFTERLLVDGDISLYEKRRYLYPILLLPITLLPGSMLGWLAWLQHGFGLLTLIPLAYIVRKTFVHWRWLVVPVTAFYAGMPMVIWYEHELLGENVFFAAVIWTCAGWVAWVSENDPARKRRLWWYFFAALAALLLTKPAGRFILPGVLLGLVWVKAWHHLGWKHFLPLGVVAVLMSRMGGDGQGMYLLYASAFPLTQLETPLHAEYKAEIRDLVGDARQRLHEFRMDEDRAWKRFLKNPGAQSERPLWQELGRSEKRMVQVYRELALEGMKARPDLFALIALQRLLSSANANDFRAERFETDYFSRKFERHYERFTTEKPERLRMILGLSRREPLPPYAEIRARLEPHPNAPAAQWIERYVEIVEKYVRLENDTSDDRVPATGRDTPTALGWWLAAGILLSLTPYYFRRLGLWAIIIGGYVFGVFLVGSANARFFGAAWPILTLLLAVPLDVLLLLVVRSLDGRRAIVAS